MNRQVDIARASESIAEMIADWYGSAVLPNARISADVIAQRLMRFVTTDDTLNDIAAENEAARDDEWGEAGE